MFKKMSIALIFVLGLMLSIPAFSAPSSGSPVVLKFATTNLTTGTWVSLVNTTAKAIKGLVLASSGTNAGGVLQSLEIGIAGYTAAPGAEVAQLVIPSTTATTAVYIPMTASGQLRISAIALDDTISKGELLMTLIYN